MKFRIPAQSPQPTGFAPRNYGRAERYYPAQQELDHVIPAANAQYLEAIAVDGLEINYWRRSREGAFCTCSDDGRKHNARNALSSDAIQESMDPQDTGSISKPISFKVRGAWDNREKDLNATQTVFGVDIGKLPEEENGQEKIIDYKADLSDEDLEKSVDADAVVTMGPDAGIIFGGEHIRCGICFGTGHVGGYSLLQGKREIFDMSGMNPVLDLRGFYVDRNEKPYAFTAPLDTKLGVYWLYELPTYFEACHKVILRNNIVAAKNLVVEYKLNNSNDEFQPLTVDWLNSRRGTPTKIIIRVRPAISELSAICKFTHLEIMWQYAVWPKVQMPALSKSTNFSVFDSLITTEFTLPPTMVAVDKEDVLFDTKHYKLWKITDVTDFKTSTGHVMGWSANARIVQDYEQVSLLRLIRQNHYELGHSRLDVFSALNLSDSDNA